MWVRSVTLLLVFLAPSALILAEAEVRLSPPREFSPAVPPEAVALADVDRDGLLDAIIVSQSPAQFTCYRGAGDGTLGDELATRRLYLQPTDLVVDNFDNDPEGLPDVAAINKSCG